MTPRKRVSIAAVAAGAMTLLLTLGAVAPSGAIIDGDPAEVGDVPWMASLSTELTEEDRRFGFEYPHDCGASIVDEWWVLTAAHCVSDRPTWVEVGLVDLDRPDRRYDVAEVVMHPDAGYLGGSFIPDEDKDRTKPPVDLALLKLAGPVELEPGRVEIISLNPDRVPSGTPAFVAGWGKTETVYPINPDLAEKATTVADEECMRAAELGNRAIAPWIVCTVNAVAGGDSGGPLYLRSDDLDDDDGADDDTDDGLNDDDLNDTDDDAALIGVVSGGFGTSIDGVFTVYDTYTSIADHIHWIERHIDGDDDTDDDG